MNDNQNNYVTRSTSRVLAEPGGRSTISLFGNPAPPPPQAQAPLNVTKSNHHDAHAMPLNTAEESSADIAAKIKARNESDHFSLCGLGGTSTATATNAASSDTTNAADAISENHHPNTIHDQNADAAKLIKKKNEETHFSLFGGPPSSSGGNATSSNAFASASTTNSYNVITDRPTSRVIQPPGGKTSITLG